MNLFHLEAGAGDPILLIHGTGFNADVWTPVASELAGEHRVISYDRRGYGRSGGEAPPREGYYRRHAEDVADLLTRLDATPATLVGWSSGGIIALHAALAFPTLVSRVILFEPPLHSSRGFNPMAIGFFIRLLMLKAMGRTSAAAELFLRKALARRDGGSAFDRLPPDLAARLPADHPTLLAELMAGTGEELTREMLAGLDLPVAILAGGESTRLLAGSMRALADIFPSAPRITLAGVAHLAMIESPAEMARGIRGGMR
jgi:pimeloyl-ACP methyl ester carboxylesterase